MTRPSSKRAKSNPIASKSKAKAKKPAPAKKPDAGEIAAKAIAKELVASLKNYPPPEPPAEIDGPLPFVYFHGASGDYYLKTPARFLRLGKSDLKMHVLSSCPSFHWGDERSSELTDGQRLLVKAQTERHVDYAGPLAGYPAGVFDAPGGKRVLVTTSPKLTLPPPVKGEHCEFIESYLAALLGTQATRFLYWLKCARESLEKGDRRPGQMWVFAGPPGSAKSFAQYLVTQVLGGRSCDPWGWMCGDSPFNAHVAQNESWGVEETNGSTDPRSRNRLAERIKQCTVGGLFNVVLKGKDITISVELFRRLHLSLNYHVEEPQNLLIVPPMAQGFRDKVCLSLCSPAQATLFDDRMENQRRLAAELPCFIRKLKALPIPKELRCPRYGVKEWHHPELLAALRASEPSVRLLEIIDEVLFPEGSKSAPLMCQTASAVHHAIRNQQYSFEVDKLLHFPGACGTLLGKLKLVHPARISSTTSNGQTTWNLYPPPPRDTKTDTLPGM